MQHPAREINAWKLPVAIDQVVKSHTQYALPLCAICTEKNAYPWVLKNFIQIKSFPEPSASGNHMKYCLEDGINHSVSGVDYSEVLDVEIIDLSDVADLISFAEDSLKNGAYLHAGMDEYFLPPKTMYEKKHYIHPSLVYGFDSQAGKLNLAGFVTLFELFDIEYNDFVSAVNKAVLVDRKDSPLSHKQMDMYAYKSKKLPQIYPFSVWELIGILEDYLYKRHEDHWVYGISVYDVVNEYLDKPFCEDKFIKYNTVHLLSEHKYVFRSALQYVTKANSLTNESGAVLEKYSEVIKLFDRVKFVFMELAVKTQTWPFVVGRDSAGIIKNYLRDAIDVEKRVLNDFFDLLRRVVSI